MIKLFFLYFVVSIFLFGCNGQPIKNVEAVYSIDSVESDLVVMDQERIERELLRKKEIRNNILSSVDLGYDEPEIYSVGGVKSFRVVINNKTGYILNNVVVSVDYYTENGGLYERQFFDFKDVPSNTPLFRLTKETNRGLTFKVAIDEIKSRALNLHYVVNPEAGRLDDPYLIQ